MHKEGMTYIYGAILLNHEKRWNRVICTNMDGPRDYTKWSNSNREKQKYIIYMWNLKNKRYKCTYLQNTDIENTPMVTKGEKVGRDKLEVWN